METMAKDANRREQTGVPIIFRVEHCHTSLLSSSRWPYFIHAACFLQAAKALRMLFQASFRAGSSLEMSGLFFMASTFS
jgi:hypothetical protein